MLRGYRFLLAASLAGLILICLGLGSYVTALSYPDENRYQPYGYANEDGGVAPASVAKLSKAEQDRTPCVDPQSSDDSDLCAQWRAARAAERSADWTMWSVGVGIVGSAFLLWQIMLTRKAVEDTGDATNAMKTANALAAESLAHERSRTEIELAPYVYPESMYLQRPTNVLENEDICIVLKNFGQTPALALTASFQTQAVPYPIESKIPRGLSKASFVSDLPPGGTQRISKKLNRIAAATKDKIGKSYALVIYLELQYSSRFGDDKIRLSKFYVSEGEDWTKGAFRLLTATDDASYKK